MSFSRTAYCDWCESVVGVEDEDELLLEGWLTVCFGDGGEDARRDFCSLPCLVKWAGSPGAVDLVEAALRGEED